MNAVNLIPSDARKRQVSVSASPITLGVIGGLLAVLVAAVLYVSAANDVTARKSELARVTASVTSWQATVNSYAALVASSQQRSAQIGAVKQLADARFPWSKLLGQISGLMPERAALSTLTATTPTSSTSSSSTVTPTPTASAPPSVSLSGCAQSQATVAQTMVQLHKINGVTAVSLASATEAATSSGTAAQSGQGACPFPVQFQISLTFSAPSSSAAASPSTTPASGSTPTSGSTPAATPASATATTSNGAS